jgi:2-desacetyl-2-hydroxyethyl bacteriochlorophyllide A dehydrogenase
VKAICLQEPRHFELIDITEPSKPGTGEVLVRVHRVGICGTDISGYLGKMPFYSYPRIPGHELGVEVLEVGPSVSHIQPGDRCSVEPYINNPESFASRRGHSNCCNELRVLGVHTDGGMRPRFVVPARKLHKSDRLTLEQLALVETLGIGCHAINRCQPVAGEHLLVIGAGPIGLAVVEFAKLAEVELTVMDINSQRLEFCRRVMSVAHTVQFRGDGSELEQLQEITRGNLFPVVLDATGNAASMSGALNYVAHTGKLVFVGIVTDEIHFRHPLMHAREMTLYASRNSLPADFQRIIRLIEDGRIDTRPWITHRTSMPGMIAQFDSYTRPETGVIKAIVEIGE